VIVVAANPVDLMALVALRHAGLPVGRVIGTGTLLIQQVTAAGGAIGRGAASVDGMCGRTW
jgi:L-lactate dehydrogenase